MIKLTNNAISTMISQGSGKGDRFIVQAYNIKDKQDFLRFEIKDTTTSIKAVIYLTRPELNILSVFKKPNHQNSYLIKVTDFTTHNKNDKLMIEIINFVPLNDYNAPPLKTQESPKNNFKPQIKQEQKLGMKTQKKQGSNSRKAIQSTKLNDYSMERRDDEFEDVSDEQLRQFQKISDLYIDFQGRWEIVVRVIQKSYRQFTSKSNKLTKIFTMTLIDRTGMKIQGTMFGDNAKEYHDLIKLNHVYRMSRGQVREENYNQSKPKEFSRYNIIFSKNSIFIPVKEVKSIPRGHENDNTIDQVILESDFDKVYSVTAILLQIGEERHFEKEQRTICKKSLLVGDPESKKAIQVTIWSKDLYIDPMWIQKSILLKNFKLSNYRDSLSFNSTFKSEIIPKQNHRFNKYQGKYQKLQYDVISGRDDKVQQKERSFRTIKQIENELMYANGSEAVISELQVWLTHMSFKSKWFYDACNNPKCKKQAVSNQKCFHCGHNNATAQRRFILPIELSDWTGSIWATAFDEFSHQIFKGQSLEQLAKMDQNRLKEEAQCRLYQQFKLRVSSKKQAEGNVKHSITGKVSEVNIQKASISNIEKIKRALF